MKTTTDIIQQYVDFLNDIKFKDTLEMLGIKYSVKFKRYYHENDKDFFSLISRSSERASDEQIDEIFNNVVNIFGYKPEIIKSKLKNYETVAVRSVFYKEVKRLHPLTSLSRIGSHVNRNHATVLYSLNKIQYDTFMQSYYEFYINYKEKKSIKSIANSIKLEKLLNDIADIMGVSYDDIQNKQDNKYIYAVTCIFYKEASEIYPQTPYAVILNKVKKKRKRNLYYIINSLDNKEYFKEIYKIYKEKKGLRKG